MHNTDLGHGRTQMEIPLCATYQVPTRVILKIQAICQCLLRFQAISLNSVTDEFSRGTR